MSEETIQQKVPFFYQLKRKQSYKIKLSFDAVVHSDQIHLKIILIYTRRSTDIATLNYLCAPLAAPKFCAPFLPDNQYYYLSAKIITRSHYGR